MSHFTVAVITKESGGKAVAKALAPFQENNMGDCPKEFLKFNDLTESLLKEYNEGEEGNVNFYKEKYGTFEEFVEEYHEYEKDEETGKYGYWENPNRKWDWYSIGGRWAGSLKVKKGTSSTEDLTRMSLVFPTPKKFDTDQARKSDIDFESMKEEKIREAEETWAEYELKLKSGEQFHPYWEFGIEINEDTKETETKEQFIRKRSSGFQTFAFLKDGKWYERGNMGWWGIVTDKKESDDWISEYQSLLDTISDDEYITIVDCHI